MEAIVGAFVILASIYSYTELESEKAELQAKVSEIEYRYENDTIRKTLSAGEFIQYGARVKHWVPSSNYFISDLSLQPQHSSTVNLAPYDPSDEYTSQVKTANSTSVATPVAVMQMPIIRDRSCSGEVTTILTSDLDTPRDNKDRMMVRETIYECS